jgi:hypothetical protein
MKQVHEFNALSLDGEALTSKVIFSGTDWIVKLWADGKMILSRRYPSEKEAIFASWEMVNP